VAPGLRVDGRPDVDLLRRRAVVELGVVARVAPHELLEARLAEAALDGLALLALVFDRALVRLVVDVLVELGALLLDVHERRLAHALALLGVALVLVHVAGPLRVHALGHRVHARVRLDVVVELPVAHLEALEGAVFWFGLLLLGLALAVVAVLLHVLVELLVGELGREPLVRVEEGPALEGRHRAGGGAAAERRRLLRSSMAGQGGA